MKTYSIRLKAVLIVTAALFSISIFSLQAQEKAPAATVPVSMTVTLSVTGDKKMPEVSREDVMVKEGKARLRVTGWTPATGDHAGLNLFVLIDDACDPSLGSQFDDLRAFINALPPTASVGVGYMSNATVQIVQNFTKDHALAAKAIRLPMATVGSYGSPYLSVIDLMKGWPASSSRREVIMVTDGIDRARRGLGGGRSLAINPDVDSASSVAQRTGTIIHTIYSPGIGRMHRNFWEATTGQNSISKLSEETGGESYYLGLQSPVTIKPYLDGVQTILANQYILEFQATPRKKAGLLYVKLTTEIAGVELVSADSVWVPAAK